MGEQRTRFRSTSEVVYKVKSDMSVVLFYFVEGRSSGKGDKGRERGRRHAQLHEIDRPNFSHRYLFLRNTHYSIGTLSGIFIPHSRVGRSTVLCGKRTLDKSIKIFIEPYPTTECVPQRQTQSRLVLLVCFSHTSVSPAATSFNLVLAHISGSPSDY